MLYPQRGMIYDTNMRILALSFKVFSIYANPTQIKDKEETALKLASALGVNKDKIRQRINKKKMFVWIKRMISDNDAESIKALKLKGVKLLKENKRYYPNAELGAQVLGFTDIDGRGLEGIEHYYDQYLKGKPGRRSLLRDAKQRRLSAFEFEFVPAVDGYNLVLNIDLVMQHIVEEQMELAYKKYNAKSAAVVVMNPENGEIYAIANSPNYDPNFLNNTTPEQRRNRAICDFFEPGSTFKIITACAALEEKVVSPDDEFFCENGSYTVSAGHTLHDHKAYGTLTFVEIIEKSSNIGMAKIGKELGQELLYEYIKKFGFGSLTGIDLPGETSGLAWPVNKWSKLSITSIPMGQEICVSVLQMARAMCVIANGGYLVKPHIVGEIIDNHKQTIKKPEFEKYERIISGQTAETMRKILKGVVDKGTGRRAKIEGYSVAGKTGTAQKVIPKVGYSHTKFIASFIGFVPVESPRFVIAVVFDEPKPQHYGGLVCAPVFKNIAEQLLKYKNIPKIKPVSNTVGIENEI